MGFQVDAPCVVLVTITDKTLIFHRVTLVWGALLVADPLYIFTEDYLLPAVVKFSGTAVGVVGDILRSLERSTFLKKASESGRTERMRRVTNVPPIFARAASAIENAGIQSLLPTIPACARRRFSIRAASIRVIGLLPSSRLLPRVVGKSGSAGLVRSPEISR